MARVPAAMRRRDVLPRLSAAECKLLAVGIGTDERARDFCAHVGFPEEHLFADPENAAYDALGLNKGATLHLNPAKVVQRF